MNAIVARQFIVSRLTPIKFVKLHELERENTVHFTPHEIHRRARLSGLGSVPEDFLDIVAPQVVAIYEKIRVNFFDDAGNEGIEPDMLDILHETDKQVKRQGISFNFKGQSTGAQVVSRINKAMNIEAKDEIPF